MCYSVAMHPHSIYLHIPFCRHRCGYCDFNTYAGMENVIPAYIEALIQEIRQVGAAGAQRYPVHTVFWGGGTPSLVPIELIAQVVAAMQDAFELLPAYEMTLEANPGTVSPAYLSDLRRLGFNRLSYGMQSAQPAELRLLEREHSLADVADAVKWARQAGFENLSLDLIYGLPFQSLESWQHTLETAIGFNPEHLSLYALTIEEGTPLHRMRSKGLIADPDDDVAADMYEWSMAALEQAGFRQYEISNWAKTDPNGSLYSCRHNLQYWLDQPYFGFGAGAHGYVGDFRTANVRGVREYIRRVSGGAVDFPKGPALHEFWAIDTHTAMQETMMVGLRLTEEGIHRADFIDRFGLPVETVFGREIQDLVQKGLLEDSVTHIRLTRRGRLLGNQVFMQFVGD
jgi:oxygen-independent coproporphyrinogen III oxidase